MPVAQVAIVGRPNVGKSSLFNWLARKRLAIVDDVAGVTRDRVTHIIEADDRYFELVDTGGIGIVDADNLTDDVERQIRMAMESSDLILFVVDTRAGVVALDQEVARRLHDLGRPVICVANKADHANLDNQRVDFHRLGFSDLIAVSARENRGRDDLLELIVERLPIAGDEPPVEAVMKVAIIGRRNVGKSTFINSLVNEERMITSEVPGTTRDSGDVRFELDGKAFMAIDTPGFRRTRSVRTDLEFYSTHRAERSIRRADVVLLFLDAAEPISKVDKHMADLITAEHKPCIFVVNKWDLYAGKVATEEWAKYIQDTFRTMRFAPVAFVTGKTGKNTKMLLNHAQMLYRQANERIGTGELNRLLEAAVAYNEPPMHKNRRPKLYYATQVAVAPPTIVIFASDPKSIGADYERYLLNYFRDHLPFGEIPIKLCLRQRSGQRGGKPRDRASDPGDVQNDLDFDEVQ